MDQEGEAAGRRTRAIVTGAAGRMGREVIAAVNAAPDMILAGAVSRSFDGLRLSGAKSEERVRGQSGWPLEAELRSRGVGTYNKVETCLGEADPDVLIDFTVSAAAPSLIRAALEAGVGVVSGTTGIPPSELEGLGQLATGRDLGLVVAPNFSLGATVLGLLARTAAPYFRGAEIVELHHDQKRDAPSGTALALGKVVGENLERPGGGRRPSTGPARAAGARDQVAAGQDEPPSLPARGLAVSGVPVHSVRLSGLVAHHEIIFASTGETLSLRHDSMSRASFMPGVLFAVRSLRRVKGLVTSLEELLRLTGTKAI